MNSHLGYSNNERGEKEITNRGNNYPKDFITAAYQSILDK